ncbi:serpin family protein, partial [bacterium]|nr:serpin family protein [bacterium]
PTPFKKGGLLVAYNKFGCSLFNEVFKPEKNTFISPISISLALAMTYNGAENKTKEEMASVLNISGCELSSFNKANKELIKQLIPDNDSLKLSIANSLWAKENAPFKAPFLNIARKFYHAEIENVDFLNPKTVPRINDWVEKKTEDKIKDLLAQNDVNKDTLLVLINAIYFKDKWEIPFEKRFTKMKDFHLTEGNTKKVPMMSNTDDFLYFESPEYQAIQLPYSDNRLKMVIFLPGKSSSLKNFLETFSKNGWEEHIKKFRMKKGTVLLPKFKMEFKIKLKKILSILGMPIAFDKDNANFRKMCELKPDENLFIDKVIHKAFIEVDEIGTEAAAATFVAINEITSMAPSQPFKMIIDRPFFFTIYDSRSKAILFMGTVANP